MNTEMMIYSLMGAIFTALIIFFYKRQPIDTTKKHLPPTPPSLPIVGHLHLLKQPLHRALQSFSHRYGPVFRLRLGYCPILVISSPEAVEDCFSRNNVVFASRPDLLIGEVIGYDFTNIAWAPYGDLWRNLRRVATIHALSASRLQESTSIRTDEIRSVARKFLLAGGGKVDLHETCFRLTRDVVMRTVSGSSWRSSPDQEMFNSPKILSACDFFPVLRWMGFKRMEKQMHQVWAARDRVAIRLLEEARKEEKANTIDIDQGRMNKSMVEELLALQKAEPDYYTDHILRGIITLMLTAGSDTSARTMEWAMSALLNHPTILQKARVEIDTQVGTTRLVEDSDFPNLPFLRCIVNETLRLFPPAPLLVPHLSSEDATVAGYHAPKGTILLVNAWGLQRDPGAWEEPLAFRPERFLGGDSIGFKFIPFGVGRRVCPGLNLAMRMMVLALATWIQCFEWESMDGEVVDMEEQSSGTFAMGKTQNLVAICRPRACMLHLLSHI